MIENTFALGTWEIHLQTENEQNIITNEMKRICSYLDTAINYNNDYLFAFTCTHYESYKLISKIAPCHFPYYEFFISNHLKCLKRDKIDIMLIHSSRGKWQDLAIKMNLDKRFIEVGVSNFSISEIEEYKNLIGHYPSYNEIEINPCYIDLKTINYCKERNIKIISYGIFGGKYRAQTYVAKYSLPYLISYASKYSDIVILKPECERHVNEIIDVVNNYEITNEEELDNITNDKAIIPMEYTVPVITKYAYNIKTYHNAAGVNLCTKKQRCQILIDTPNFEMLGDYMAYLRYLYRNEYGCTQVYYYDWLSSENGKYYVVHLYDKNGKLSKINNNEFGSKVELLEITEFNDEKNESI